MPPYFGARFLKLSQIKRAAAQVNAESATLNGSIFPGWQSGQDAAISPKIPLSPHQLQHGDFGPAPGELERGGKTDNSGTNDDKIL